jgi:hypothetical protein
VDFQLVFSNDLVPAPNQILLARPVQPQLALGRDLVRLGIDPLTLGKILDRIGYFVLLQNQGTQAMVLGSKRRVQAGRTRPGDNEVIRVRIL